jgi:hypothetical protein
LGSSIFCIIKIQKKNLGFLILFSFALACFNIARTLGVTLSGAAIATVLVYSSAGFTALLGYFFLQESFWCGRKPHHSSFVYSDASWFQEQSIWKPGRGTHWGL